MPIERAEPAIVRTAASRSAAVRSFILVLAISSTWARVSLPTLSRCGFCEPLSTLAYVGSGSFLVTERGVRRFSPTEVARLMGLPEAFRFPSDLGLEKRYKLLGNGLSIPVAAWVLKHLMPGR